MVTFRPNLAGIIDGFAVWPLAPSCPHWDDPPIRADGRPLWTAPIKRPSQIGWAVLNLHTTVLAFAYFLTCKRAEQTLKQFQVVFFQFYFTCAVGLSILSLRGSVCVHAVVWQSCKLCRMSAMPKSLRFRLNRQSSTINLERGIKTNRILC